MLTRRTSCGRRRFRGRQPLLKDDRRGGTFAGPGNYASGGDDSDPAKEPGCKPLTLFHSTCWLASMEVHRVQSI
jgi:hypothetical protein